MPVVQLPRQILSRTMDGTKVLPLQALEGVFSIFDEQEFVGLIQKIRLEDSNLHIGRFFINPQKQEQDLGSQALRKFVSLAFENEDIDSISLNVFEANQRAQNLYQKEGFEIVQMVEAPVRKYSGLKLE